MSPIPFGFRPANGWESLSSLPDCPTCKCDVFVEEIEGTDNVVGMSLYVCGKCGHSFVEEEPDEPVAKSSSTPDTGGTGGTPADATVPSSVGRGNDAPLVFGEVTEE